MEIYIVNYIAGSVKMTTNAKESTKKQVKI